MKVAKIRRFHAIFSRFIPKMPIIDMDDIKIHDCETRLGGAVMDFIREYPLLVLWTYPEAWGLVYLWYNLVDPDGKEPEQASVLQNPPFG